MRAAFAIVIAAAAASCDGATEGLDAAGGGTDVQLTPAFVPLLCTSGNAGDPSCPITYVDLSSTVGTGRLELLATPEGERLLLREIELTAGAAPFKVRNLMFVVLKSDLVVPVLGAFPSGVIDLPAGGVIVGSDVALESFVPTSQLALQYEAVP